MKQVYLAVDNKVFCTKNECEAHELEVGINYVKMYDGSGVAAENADDAFAVFCSPDGVAEKLGGDNYSLGGAAFVNMCKKEKTVSKGINEQSFGWFIWNEDEKAYVQISDAWINVIRALPLSTPKVEF